MRAVYKGSQRVYYKYRSFSRIYTTSSSITIPSTAVNIQVWCVGGGGSGGGWWYPNNVIVGGGGVNLYFYRLGTATSVLSMEDIDN